MLLAQYWEHVSVVIDESVAVVERLREAAASEHTNASGAIAPSYVNGESYAAVTERFIVRFLCQVTRWRAWLPASMENNPEG